MLERLERSGNSYFERPEHSGNPNIYVQAMSSDQSNIDWSEPRVNIECPEHSGHSILEIPECSNLSNIE